MKRLIAWLLGAILLGFGGAAAYLLAVFPRHQPPASQQIERTAERLARGTYLAEHVAACTECHADRDWSLSGAPPLPPVGSGRAECLSAASGKSGMSATFPGRLCFANITPDLDTGVGAWTDGELLRAIREGVDREGHALFPIMPYFIFRQLSDEDARSLVVWLRSLPPVRRAQPPGEVDFPVNLFIRLVPRPLSAPVAGPAPENEIERGRYLATIGRCAFCHSPRRGQDPTPLPGRQFSGGNEFRGPFGVRWSSNLTPDPGGLGPVSRDEFIAMFRRRAVPKPVAPADNTIMPWVAYAGMSDGDLGAIYAYLRTVPAVAGRRD